MKHLRKVMSVLISILCILSAIVFNGSDINMVKGDDPPLDNGESFWNYPELEPYQIFNAPQINWSKFWQVFKNHAMWRLEGSLDGETWYEEFGVTNLTADVLNLQVIPTGNNSRKITLDFTAIDPLGPSDTAYYRFSFAIDYRVKNFVNRSGVHEYTLTYEADGEEFNVTFNWSDYVNSPLASHSHVKKGITNIGGHDYFYFRVISDNPVQVGTFVELDPEYTVFSGASTVMYYPSQRKIVRLSNGTFYCTFAESNDVHVAYSVDAGETWTDKEVYGAHSSFQPSLCVDSNDVVHMVWYGDSALDTDDHIRYCNSTDWTDIRNISYVDHINYIFPAIAVDSNDNLHVAIEVYDNYGATDTGVIYINSTDNGASWSPIKTLVTTGDSSIRLFAPSIAINSTDSIHIIYYWENHYSGKDAIYHVQSSDGGITFTGSESDLVLGTAQDENYPCLVIDDDDSLISVNGDSDRDMAYRINRTTSSSWQNGDTTEEIDDDSLYPTVSVTGNGTIYAIAEDMSSHDMIVLRNTTEANNWDYRAVIAVGTYVSPNALCSQYPIIGGLKTNRPATGYCYIVEEDDTDITFYASSDLTWDTGVANVAPTQSAQKIWNSTTSTEKSLNATGVSLTPTCFNVTIADIDADQMNVTIKTNESGTWTTVNATTSGMSNGTYHGYNTSWVDSYNTKYWISFNVSDDSDWCNETFNFTTESAPWSNTAPTLTNEIPTNASTDISRWCQLNITVTDADGNNSKVYFYTNASGGVWYLLQTNTSVLNTTVRLMNFTNASSYSTKYWWKVSANDTHDNTTEIYHFTTESDDTTPPNITINFAGNLSDSGGPYWRPPGESDILDEAGEGIWRDGYYANASKQHEDGIYCNVTANDSDSSVTNVWLQWLNGTTWTNWTYAFVNTVGEYWEYNTSGNIQTCEGYDYSFNIVANSSGGTNTTYWNKTGLGGSYTRRCVQLNCTQQNISYVPFYIYDATYTQNVDTDKADRLHHDQGADGTYYDTGYLLYNLPTDAVTYMRCGSFHGNFFDNNNCTESFTLNNIYYHVWWKADDFAASLGWDKQRNKLTGVFDNYIDINNTNNNRSQIFYNVGFGDASNIFTLSTLKLDVTPTSFTDNDIYEGIFYKVSTLGEYPTEISNRSFTSFVLLNVPDNATLNASYADTDSDSLSDWTELYVTYTNPFLADTDNDGINDYWENQAGSDPNNWTEVFNVSIWIDITNASWDLGNVVMGSSTWTNETGKTFIADMDNCSVNTDLKLQVTNDGADWSAATSGNGPGVDTYRLNASIDSWVTEFQIVTASLTTISLDIVAGQNETFDLRFDAPTSTSVSTQQSITVTATLVKH